MGTYGIQYARPLDDNMSFQIALDLIARKQETIGINSAEFRIADHELKMVLKGSWDKKFLFAYSDRLQFVIGHP